MAEGERPSQTSTPPGAIPARPLATRASLGDLLGGVSAAAVVLPQAMGLGVVLFVAMGLEPSRGAVAGLLGAIVLSLGSGLVGATRGMISAPNGPVTMLLVAAVGQLVADGLAPADLPIALAVILLAAGALQLLLGVSGGGQLVKHIPFPVVAGLVTGVGVLMIRAQVDLLGRLDSAATGEVWRAIPALTAVVTLAGIYATRRLAPQIPAVLGGLLCGIACFHGLLALGEGTMPPAWVVGATPEFALPGPPPSLAALSQLPWPALATIALATALLASIDCLLTAVLADGRTGTRHDAGRELSAQGVAQMATALLGGVGGGGTKGATLVAIAGGGGRWPALATVLVLLAMLLFTGQVGTLLPLAVLAGVLVYVGISLIDINLLGWLARRRMRTDALIGLTVTGASLVYDLLAGVAVGVIGSILIFVRAQLQQPVLHTRATGRERRSLKERSEEENRLLDEHGERIVYVELRGNLFFGNAERLFNALSPDLDRPVWMVVNMRRLQQIDTTALHLMRQMAARLRRSGGTMVYANVFKHTGGVRKMHKAFRQLGRFTDLPKVKTFASSDAALEFAERRLLRSLGWEAGAEERRIDLAGNRLCAALDPRAVEILARVLRPLRAARKTHLFLQGEYGDTLYLVLRGEVETRLAIGRYHYKRVGKIGPGGYFGKIALLQPGPSSSTATVVRDAELLLLDRAGLDALIEAGEHDTVLQLFAAITRAVAGELRWARAELARVQRQ